MKILLLFLLLIVYPLVVQAQTPSDTCANGDQLTLDTVNKRYKCVTPGTQPLPVGSGTNMTVANASSTGTTVNRLAKLTGAPSTAVIAATSDTENAIGIVTAGAGTTGNATITILGQATCDFDNATVAGDYFVISAITAGKCHDAGSTYPTSGATYGRVLSTNVASGAYVVELMTPDIAFQNAGNGKSKPGGSNTQLQYNASNQFGGISGATSDGSTVTFASGYKIWLPAAGCANTTAASFWDLPTSTPAVAACVTGTNTQKGVLQYADTSGGFSAQSGFLLPADWAGAIDAKIIWRTSATSGNAKFSLSTICTATDATETDDPSFNTASTVTTAAPGTTLRLQTSAITTVTITGCAASELLHLKLFRDGNDGSDTLSASLDVIGVEVTIRRAQ